MKYLSFFDDVEKIILEDELAKFLGVNEDGIIEFGYADIVKSAGHSCGTVAGAYLIALKGLKALYGEEVPKRGEIKIEIKKIPEDDNAGVVGCVLSNITGATTNYGFGGIPTGKFNRRNLLFYNADIDTDVRFTRLDTNKQVGINYRPRKIVNPMKILMSAIGENATDEDKKTFPIRFQEMVKTVLENADIVIEIS
ncbi:MAG: hypothetical protein L3J44_01145 [Campylobacteraceae bacterium]|nr:hypothetical protein [Campylobacteraceae bacterium]